MLSATAAVLLSVTFTILYVLPFYFSPTTQPSPTLSRDAPSVIRARIRFVSTSVAFCSIFTIYLLSIRGHLESTSIAHYLGWYPIAPSTIGSVTFLTAILFTGPLFERAVIDSGWRQWMQGKPLYETLSSWIGWRNLVAGPITEEVLFRSLLLSLHLLIRPAPSPSTLIFATPLYFGIAHIHHFYEYTLTHPFTPIFPALLRSVFQFGYTTVFGWYTTFLFLRTGNVWGVILVHSFCNWLGLPRIWGRVGGVTIEGGVVGAPLRGKEDEDRNEKVERSPGIAWTVAYYALLALGAVTWWKSLWVLTASDQALLDIGTAH
ncbi:CAAX prenyl protease [Lecanora helva]